jgi:uncharacterized lipoprotein YmbA
LASGCVGTPLPAAQWVRLPVQPLTAVAPPATPSAQTWQLLGTIALPGHLDHGALLLPGPPGPAGLGSSTRLVAHPQLRWAEPLRDAVPRLLRQDLQQALGAPLWMAPLPATLQPTRQLRLELLALEAQAAPGTGVAVHARWELSGPGLVPTQGEVAFVQPAEPARGQRGDGAGTADAAAAGAGADALVLAHRQALATLAQRLALVLRAADQRR